MLIACNSLNKNVSNMDKCTLNNTNKMQLGEIASVICLSSKKFYIFLSCSKCKKKKKKSP